PRAHPAFQGVGRCIVVSLGFQLRRAGQGAATAERAKDGRPLRSPSRSNGIQECCHGLDSPHGLWIQQTIDLFLSITTLKGPQYGRKFFIQVAIADTTKSSFGSSFIWLAC